MQVREIQRASIVAKPNKQLMRASQILDPTLPSKVEELIKKSNIREMNVVVEKGQISNEQLNMQSVAHSESQGEANLGSNITPYILLLALSFHGFFEGIALGLQNKDKEALYFFIAIISHKWAEAFTLGISFNKANIHKSTFIKLIILFSIFTPIGWILGIFLAHSSVLVEAIFLALSGGTFVYVSASEVIVEEFAITKHKYWKFLAFLIGGVLIAILAILEGNDHHHQE